jgi:hypothetical protein
VIYLMRSTHFFLRRLLPAYTYGRREKEAHWKAEEGGEGLDLRGKSRYKHRMMCEWLYDKYHVLTASLLIVSTFISNGFM